MSIEMNLNAESIEWEHPGTLLPRLLNKYGPFRNMLDIGGSNGVCGRRFWKVQHIHILDLFPPPTPTSRFHLGNGLDAEKIYGAKSFDLVQCTETIEHLEKANGENLLNVMESVACKLIVLTTPNGFAENDPTKDGCPYVSANPYQKHLSGWSKPDFLKFGYQVLFNGGPVAGQIIAWKILVR